MIKNRYIARIGFEHPNKAVWFERGNVCELTELEAEHLLRIDYIEPVKEDKATRKVGVKNA